MSLIWKGLSLIFLLLATRSMNYLEAMGPLGRPWWEVTFPCTQIMNPHKSDPRVPAPTISKPPSTHSAFPPPHQVNRQAYPIVAHLHPPQPSHRVWLRLHGACQQ